MKVECRLRLSMVGSINNMANNMLFNAVGVHVEKAFWVQELGIMHRPSPGEVEKDAQDVVKAALNDMLTASTHWGRANQILEKPLPRDSTSGSRRLMPEFYKSIACENETPPVDWLWDQLSMSSADSGSRYLSVVGASGTGKTRTVYEIGRTKECAMCPIRTIVENETAIHMQALFCCLSLATRNFKRSEDSQHPGWSYPAGKEALTYEKYEATITGLAHLFLFASFQWLHLVLQKLWDVEESEIIAAETASGEDRSTVYREIILQSQRNGRAEKCIKDLFRLELLKWVAVQPDDAAIPHIDPVRVKQDSLDILGQIQTTVSQICDVESACFILFLDEAQALLRQKELVVREDKTPRSTLNLLNRCVSEIFKDEKASSMGYIISGTSSGIIADVVQVDSPLKHDVRVCNFGQYFDAEKVKQFFGMYLKQWVVEFLVNNNYTRKLIGRPSYVTKFTEKVVLVFFWRNNDATQVTLQELEEVAGRALQHRKDSVKEFIHSIWNKTDTVSTGERYKDLIHALYADLRLGYTYEEFLLGRNESVGHLVECSILNSKPRGNEGVNQYPSSANREVSELEESFMRECLLEVGNENSLAKPPVKDPVLQLIESKTTGVNIASEAKGYAAEEALCWVFLRHWHQKHDREHPGNFALLKDLLEPFRPGGFELPPSLQSLKYSFADGVVPLADSKEVQQSIFEVFLDQHGGIRKILVVKTPTDTASADVMFPVFDLNGEFKYIVLIQIKNRKSNTFAQALSGLDIWNWRPTLHHQSYLDDNEKFQNVIRVPCCSRKYNPAFCRRLKNEWNDKYETDPIVPLAINEHNLNIDVKTSDIQGEISSPSNLVGMLEQICKCTAGSSKRSAATSPEPKETPHQQSKEIQSGSHSTKRRKKTVATADKTISSRPPGNF